MATIKIGLVLGGRSNPPKTVVIPATLQASELKAEYDALRLELLSVPDLPVFGLLEAGETYCVIPKDKPAGEQTKKRKLNMRTIGRLFVRSNDKQDWAYSGGCWAITPQLLIALYHCCHDFVRKKGKPFWKPFQVGVLLSGQASPILVEMIAKGKTNDLVLLKFPTAVLDPWDTAAPELYQTIMFADYPIIRDNFTKKSGIGGLPWDPICSESTVAGNAGNYSVSHYECYAGSCGYPVLNKHGQAIGSHAMMLWKKWSEELKVDEAGEEQEEDVDEASDARSSLSSAGETDDPMFAVTAEADDAAEKSKMACFVPTTVMMVAFKRYLGTSKNHSALGLYDD